MRFTAFIIMSMALLAACRTTRKQPSSAATLDSVENEQQLPACDDITVGRVYWVRSLNQQLQCAAGGTWTPRTVEPAGTDHPGAGPRTIPDPG
ncbi:hypothetical protein [Oligoflexus tunisiensis]|uniref:hypothetical protein n=1 Tax=Oligoflexus tunisiensis TaxID=708132 RepID=UPI00114CC97F|nr:hypothetical protein [Oligoflexus tunisiensis]